MITLESDTLARLIHPEKNVTPHKRGRMDPAMPPDKEYRDPEDLCDWLQGWF